MVWIEPAAAVVAVAAPAAGGDAEAPAEKQLGCNFESPVLTKLNVVKVVKDITGWVWKKLKN